MTPSPLKTLALSTALAVVFSGGAMAQTAPGTVITNTISLNYNTGAGEIVVAEEDLPTRTFTVDRKIDLSLRSTRDPEAEVTAPGGTAQAILAFELTNNGNGTQDFAIEVTQPAGNLTLTPSETPTLTPAAGEYSVVTSTTNNLSGTVSPLDGNIDDLGPNESIFVLIVANIPIDTEDNLFRDFTVTATTLTEAGGEIVYTRDLGLDGENVIAVDTVSNSTLAPDTQVSDATDGIDADQARLRVSTPMIVARKTVAVISEDPDFACNDLDSAGDAASATAGAFPGACLEYRIEIENTSVTGAAATSIVVTDDLPAQVSIKQVSQITYSPAYAASGDIQPTVADPVTATINTLPADTTATIRIRVTVD